MKNRKKFLLFIILCFVFAIKVSAETIICDYDAYKIEFYTNEYDESDYGKWSKIYDKQGRATRDRIDKVQIFNESQCPNEIYLYHEHVFFTITSGGKKYNLVSSRTIYDKKDTTRRKVSCGNISGIPKKIPELTSMGITMIEIVVPVILVVMGMIDFFKGITAQKEDEIKKGQQTFIKRMIVAGLIFFVIMIVKLLVSIVADASNSKNIVDCIDCFLSGSCS